MAKREFAMRVWLFLITVCFCKAAYIENSNNPSPIGTQSHEQIAIASEGLPVDYPIKKEPYDEVTVVRSESSYTVPRTTTPITVQFSEDLRELNPEDSAEIRQMTDIEPPYLYEEKQIEVQEQPRIVLPSNF